MADTGFYEVIAQVIPVLFLTMAIGEARVQVRDTIVTRNAILGVLFIGGVLVAGELAALHVLEVGHGTRITKDLAVLALAVGLGWIVRSLASVVYRDRGDDEEAEPPAGLAVLIDASFFVTAIIVVVALIL
jgi:hypothetical protein